MGQIRHELNFLSIVGTFWEFQKTRMDEMFVKGCLNLEFSEINS